jgi:hypothetical protein
MASAKWRNSRVKNLSSSFKGKHNLFFSAGISLDAYYMQIFIFRVFLHMHSYFKKCFTIFLFTTNIGETLRVFTV